MTHLRDWVCSRCSPPRIPGYVAPQKLQIASYDLQDIVEIVRSTPMT